MALPSGFYNSINNGCSTPFDISDPFTCGLLKPYPAGFVLNAFRHRRSIHSITDTTHVVADMCSTPLDISDPFTLVNRLDDFPNGPVLNAFRHLRSIHFFLRCHYRFLLPCSTPFDISDPFTDRNNPKSLALLGAQRLSTSQIHSQRDAK